MLHIEELVLLAPADVVADTQLAAALGRNFPCPLWITSTVSAHRCGKRGEKPYGNVA